MSLTWRYKILTKHCEVRCVVFETGKLIAITKSSIAKTTDDISSQSKRCPNATQTFQTLRRANPLVRNANLPQVLGCAETNHRLLSLLTRWMKAVVVDPTIRNQSYVDFRIVNPVHRSFCLNFKLVSLLDPLNEAGLSTCSVLYLIRWLCLLIRWLRAFLWQWRL